MALIFVTRKLPGNGISLLQQAGHEVVINEKDESLSNSELLQAISGRPYEAVISLLSDVIDSKFFEAAPNLKIVANYAVGYNNINLDEAQKRGIVVTNTPDVLTDTVAEFTLALIMSVAKRIPESERFLRAGKYKGWAPELFLGSDLKDKTLGILGAGRIGRGVAKRASLGLGMKVIYNDVNRNEEFEKEINCRYFDSVDEVVSQSDVVSVHVPLLDSTKHLINGNLLSKMKSSAYLINTSRGPVVDEKALVEALSNKVICGAGLDVFENEPALSEGLIELENVVITPHSASASIETRVKMSQMVAQNINAFFEGNLPPNLVKSN